ncbi:MAG: carbon monoxide dehydrogenase [Blastopirellula sp.]|nr:MAG: carbon monoxide dehydrogenase [Blastopirellula sp.]
MKPVSFEYNTPASLSLTTDLLVRTKKDAKLISGGQSLGPMLNLRLARPELLIDISKLSELKEIGEDKSKVIIGASITHSTIEDGGVVEPISGMLRYVASRIAYRAVRNKGTIGGSLAHADPAADWVTTMMALSAVIKTRTSDGIIRKIPMHDFMLGAYRTALKHDEIISSIEIPKYSKKACWGYHKICRKVGEFANAIGAIVVDPVQKYCIIACGAVGGAPLILQDLSESVARSAAVPDILEIVLALETSEQQFDAVKMQQLAVSVQRAIEKAVCK